MRIPKTTSGSAEDRDSHLPNSLKKSASKPAVFPDLTCSNSLIAEKKFAQQTHDLGLKLDVSNVAEVLDLLDSEETTS